MQRFRARGELESFEQALEAADEIVALPGRRENLDAAYVLVGQSPVRIADVLVAIWDGEQPRGPGGTGDVVQLALQQRVSVIHIKPDATDHLSIRALLAGPAKIASASVDDPELYRRVLRGALKLGTAADTVN